MRTQLNISFSILLLATGTHACKPRAISERSVQEQFSQQTKNSPVKDQDATKDPLGEGQKPLSVAERALKILESKCESCHNSESAAISAFDYVTKIEKMIDEKVIIPGDSSQSRLIKRIDDGTMPPDGSLPLEGSELDLLREWIDDGTEIAISQEDSVENRAFINRSEVFDAAADDIIKIPKDDRPYIRYLTSVNLYNEGASRRRISQAEAGLNKLINTFSKRKSLIRVQSVHKESIVFRLNLKDYGISVAVWKALETFYPYHHVTKTTGVHAFLQGELDTTLPLMRIDWFLAAAGKPPLYYNLLETPESLSDLEAQLGVDRIKNIQNFDVKRAGFAESIVAKHQRVIERHDTNHGFLWISYEFGSSEGNQNIFTHPLGPEGVFPQTRKGFLPGGHELFYTRPNGMLAFAVFDFQGNRMHEAPALIKDEGKIINKVVAGKTCHICHGNGPIFNEDEIREGAKGLSDSEKGLVEKLYPENSILEKQIKDDSAVYSASAKKIGITASEADPIASVSKAFEGDISFAGAAAEFSITESTFRKYLDEKKALKESIDSCVNQDNPDFILRICFEKSYGDMTEQVWQ